MIRDPKITFESYEVGWDLLEKFLIALTHVCYERMVVCVLHVLPLICEKENVVDQIFGITKIVIFIGSLSAISFIFWREKDLLLWANIWVDFKLIKGKLGC